MNLLTLTHFPRRGVLDSGPRILAKKLCFMGNSENFPMK